LSRTPLGEDRRYDLGVLVASRVNNPELYSAAPVGLPLLTACY
jgi:hypothetical protein